jgi:hypothetical protein
LGIEGVGGEKGAGVGGKGGVGAGGRNDPSIVCTYIYNKKIKVNK